MEDGFTPFANKGGSEKAACGIAVHVAFARAERNGIVECASSVLTASTVTDVVVPLEDLITAITTRRRKVWRTFQTRRGIPRTIS